MWTDVSCNKGKTNSSPCNFYLKTTSCDLEGSPGWVSDCPVAQGSWWGQEKTRGLGSSACLEQIKLSWREAQCLSHRETDWQKNTVIAPAESTRVWNIIQFSVKEKTAVVANGNSQYGCWRKLVWFDIKWHDIQYLHGPHTGNGITKLKLEV